MSSAPSIYHSSSRPELAPPRISQDSLGRGSNRSAGPSMAGSASSKAASPSPVASFTAGMKHAVTRGTGPLKIESTTGSKTTIIKDTRQRSKSKSSSRASSSYGAGISSEDVFGKKAPSAASESDTQSNTSSKISRNSRRSSGAFGSFGARKGKEKVERGISSADVFPPQRQASTSNSPSLANMLQGLRRGGDNNSVPPSPVLGGGASSSRSSSRASKGQNPHSSGPSDISESDSVLSGSSSNARRKHRAFPNVFKRKTSAERQEEEEHLQALADLRLRALALASADEESGSTGATATQRDNAELLVRNMQEARLSAIPLYRQTSSATDSSTYSQQSPIAQFANTGFGQIPIAQPQQEILHISSPKRSTPSSLRSAHSSRPGSALSFNDGADLPQSRIPISTSSEIGDATFLQHHAVDVSEDEAERQAVLAESRRRSTLVPCGKASPARRESVERHTRSGSGSGSRRSHTEGFWLTRNSFDGKDMSKPPDSGDEADMDEGPVEAELLERRRSTIKAGRMSPPGAKVPLDAALYDDRLLYLVSTDVSPCSGRRGSPRPSTSLPSRSIVRDFEAASDDNADISAITDAYAPPERTSSRPISPEVSRPVSPLKFRSGSFLDRTTSPSTVSPKDSALDKTFTAPGRDRDASMSSWHARQRAESGVSAAASGSPPSPTQPRRIFDELSSAITAAMEKPPRSPTNASPINEMKSLPSTPLQNIEENPFGTPTATESVVASPKGLGPASPAHLSHRRSSSDMAPLSIVRPAAQHRRTTSSDHVGKVSSPPPGHRRTSSSVSTRSAGRARPAGLPRLPSHFETLPQIDPEHVRKLLVRNKPFPRAALLREDLRRTKSSAERAVLYAQKINDLSICETGLEYWLLHVRPPAPSSARRHSFMPASRKASDATFRGTIGSSGPYQGGHSMRDDNMSEAPFPLRKGSQDACRAREITQRAPSIAPSTMVPSTIPYPGVYDNGQTLRTTSAMSNHSAASSSRQQANFAAAALNAAGLPSRSFFGLGRKVSKRAPSLSQQRQQRTGGTDAPNTMSISAPLQPPPGPPLSTVGRSNALKPSGPRPSISSSSSDLPSYQSTSSLHSLANGGPQRFPAISPLANPQSMQLPAISSIAYSGAVDSEAELLTAMSDILPMAPRDALLRYLRVSKGDHLAAIGRYLDDERAGNV